MEAGAEPFEFPFLTIPVRRRPFSEPGMASRTPPVEILVVQSSEGLKFVEASLLSNRAETGGALRNSIANMGRQAVEILLPDGSPAAGLAARFLVEAEGKAPIVVLPCPARAIT